MAPCPARVTVGARHHSNWPTGRQSGLGGHDRARPSTRFDDDALCRECSQQLIPTEKSPVARRSAWRAFSDERTILSDVFQQTDVARGERLVETRGQDGDGPAACLQTEKNTLTLYKNSALVQTYRVGTGTGGTPTRTCRFT